MGTKTKPKPKDGKSEAPAPSTPEDVKMITDVANDFLATLPADIIKNGYDIKVFQKKQTNVGGWVWSHRGKIKDEELGSQTLEDIVSERWGPGEYRFEAYTKKNQRLSVQRVEMAIGDLSEANTEFNHRKDSRGTQGAIIPLRAPSDPGVNNPMVNDKRAELASKKIDLELLKIDRERDVISGGGKKDNDKVMELQLQMIQKDTMSAIDKMSTNMMNSVEKIVASVKPATTAPATDPVVVKLLEKLTDDKKDSGQNDMMKMMMTMQENTTKLIVGMNEKQAEALRESDRKHNEMMLKLMEQSKNSASPFVEAQRMYDWINRRKPEDRPLPAVIERNEPSVVDKLIEGFVNILGKINENNPDLISKLFTKEPPPPPSGPKYDEAQINALAAQMAKEEVQKQLAEKNKTADAGAKTEPVKPVTAVPSAPAIPANEPPEVTAEKKKRVDAVLEKMLLEIDLKPNQSEWLGLALTTLPKDILDNIKICTKDTEVFNAIKPYASKEILDRVNSKLVSDFPALKHAEWLTKCINSLIADLKEIDGEKP